MIVPTYYALVTLPEEKKNEKMGEIEEQMKCFRAKFLNNMFIMFHPNKRVNGSVIWLRFKGH